MCTSWTILAGQSGIASPVASIQLPRPSRLRRMRDICWLGWDGIARIKGRATPLRDIYKYWRFWQPEEAAESGDDESIANFELDAPGLLYRADGIQSGSSASNSVGTWQEAEHTFRSLLGGPLGPGNLSMIQLGVKPAKDSKWSWVSNLLVQHDVNNWFSCRRIRVVVVTSNWNVDSSRDIPGHPKVRCAMYQRTIN